MKVTKTDKVLKHLQTYKVITSWDAIAHYRATRLSAIIFNLRKRGYNITTEMIYDKGGSYAVYRLEDSDV